MLIIILLMLYLFQLKHQNVKRIVFSLWKNKHHTKQSSIQQSICNQSDPFNKQHLRAEVILVENKTGTETSFIIHVVICDRCLICADQ